MDYSVEKMEGFKIIGYQRAFKFENSYEEIPKFWDEIYNTKIAPLFQKGVAETLEEKAIKKYCIGEFGLCIDDSKEEGAFQYIIGGTYTEGEVPEGMTVYELQDYEWAKFKCVGPMPAAIQTVNTKVFQEWLPGNKEFDIAAPINIEWYSSDKNTTDKDYESGVWIPVKRK